MDVTSVVALGGSATEARELLTSLSKSATTRHEVVAVVPTGASDQLLAAADELADRTVRCDPGVGTATLWNRGTAEARGEWVAYCARAEMPAGWDEDLTDSARRHPTALLVIGAPDDGSHRGPFLISPFAEVPTGSTVLMRREEAQALGPWDEGYIDAGGSLLDLCFTVWVNDRDVAVSRGSEWGEDDSSGDRGLQRRFSDKWRGGGEPRRLEAVPPDRFERNRAIAASVTAWIDRDASAADEERTLMRRQLRAMGAVNRQLQAQTAQPANRLERTARGVVGPTGSKLAGLLSPATVRRLRRALNRLPEPIEVQARRLARRIGVARGSS